jgi:hypothetical protein
MKRVPQRPLRDVPRPVLLALAVTLVAQIAWQSRHQEARPTLPRLPAPPPAAVLRAASLGEPLAAARLLLLWLQAFDHRDGQIIAYRDLDYVRLAAWLDRIIELDPQSQYALLMASRIYAEVADPARQRIMLEFIYQKFLQDPPRRWPWLAHGAIVARRQLGDLPLALKYARAVAAHPSPDMPPWALEMPAFVLEKMGELEQARIFIGGLLAAGYITDPNEIRFLEQKLQALAAPIH